MRNHRSRNRTEVKPEKITPDMRTKITNIFDLPQSSLAGTSQMEISGNREVVIDGCQGVLIYEDNIIKLALRGMIATFRGRSLQIRALTHDSAIVCGFITGIDFSV